MKNNKKYWIFGLAFTFAATAWAEGPSPTHSSSGTASDIKAESSLSFRSSKAPEDNRAAAPSTAQANEISGRVVKTDGKTLYIEHMGAIIALQVDRSTQIEGTDAKKIKALEGQDIRAVFTVKDKKQNLARIVEVADQAIGGSGNGSSDMAGNKGSVPQEPTGGPGSRTGAPSNPGY